MNGTTVALFRREPVPAELQGQQHERHQLQEWQKEQEEQAQARRERQVRITAADVEEVKSICQSALEAIDTRLQGFIGQVTVAVRETKLTRGGLIVRGSIRDTYNDRSDKAPDPMLTALTNLGFVVSDTFGRDGVIVTGWDPYHYEGAQLTSQRVRIRVRELQDVEQELLELEASDVQVRDS